jgi:nucleoprotein TPR
MMRTRRKARVATDDHEGDTSGMADESYPFVVSIPEDVDLDSLSDLLPGTSLTSPSPEAIIALYRLLLAQALEGRSITQELDEARAELEKKDVELDQALQDRESMSRDLETSLESVHTQLNQMRDERDQLGTICYHLSSAHYLTRFQLHPTPLYRLRLLR